jgi:hypothetical protein
MAVCILAQLFAHCFGRIRMKKSNVSALPLALKLRQAIGHGPFLLIRPIWDATEKEGKAQSVDRSLKK